ARRRTSRGRASRSQGANHFAGARGSRLLARHRYGHRAGHSVLLPPGRNAAAPRSRLALPTAGCARPVAGHRPALRLARRRLARPAVGRVRLLRIARRHLHPGRDVRGHHPAPRRVEGPGNHGRRVDAGRAIPRQPQLGLRRRLPLRRPGLLRRPGRPETTRQRLPRARLAVVLDVVYNHLGPEGNYLADFGPYFTDRYRPPLCAAINFDGPGSDEVRHYFIDNALFWVTDFHIDALRLDAVHAIFDQAARPFLLELAEAVHGQAERLNRRVHVIAETSLNDPRLLRPRDRGGYGLDGQWND